MASDDAIAVWAGFGHVEIGGSVPGKLIELHERISIEQHLNALASGFFAPGVLFLDRALRAGV